MPGQYTQMPEMSLYHQHYEHVQTGAQSKRERRRLFSVLYTESGLKEYGCYLDFDPEGVLDTYNGRSNDVTWD